MEASTGADRGVSLRVKPAIFVIAVLAPLSLLELRLDGAISGIVPGMVIPDSISVTLASAGPAAKNKSGEVDLNRGSRPRTQVITDTQSTGSYSLRSEVPTTQQLVFGINSAQPINLQAAQTNGNPAGNIAPRGGAAPLPPGRAKPKPPRSGNVPTSPITGPTGPPQGLAAPPAPKPSSPVPPGFRSNGPAGQTIVTVVPSAPVVAFPQTRLPNKPMKQNR